MCIFIHISDWFVDNSWGMQCNIVTHMYPYTRNNLMMCNKKVKNDNSNSHQLPSSLQYISIHHQLNPISAALNSTQRHISTTDQKC